jgi:hypothetical protein
VLFGAALAGKEKGQPMEERLAQVAAALGDYCGEAIAAGFLVFGEVRTRDILI